ncbi:MAG: hypothetical protein MNSN_08410 [Minisyncoccus archaeiphilus]|nr:MAG: hypothetical protein BWY21_01233 [Parcubacteria group bacterium ADurb.Bin216]GMX59828.1 MAG: hypothetical protein MNSN_08410 [Candidatus Parcubacteria bacterium]
MMSKESGNIIAFILDILFIIFLLIVTFVTLFGG